MIQNWFITGDCHGSFSRFEDQHFDNPSEIGIIILGDTGINYYPRENNKPSSAEIAMKGRMAFLKYNFYLVRGNHEERPENLSTMKLVFDEDTLNEVYIEEEYPNIKYLIDGETYFFGYTKALVIGGAYSTDKYFRQKYNLWWYPDEQLSKEEMDYIETKNLDGDFDIVLTHTCPRSWQPQEKFINNMTGPIDSTMEDWFEKIKKNFSWKTWLFGHYHVDRVEHPNVWCLYEEIYELNWIRMIDSILEQDFPNSSGERNLDAALLPKGPYYYDEAAFENIHK